LWITGFLKQISAASFFVAVCVTVDVAAVRSERRQQTNGALHTTRLVVCNVLQLWIAREKGEVGLVAAGAASVALEQETSKTCEIIVVHHFRKGNDGFFFSFCPLQGLFCFRQCAAF
jgi:hypothetical protein